MIVIIIIVIRDSSWVSRSLIVCSCVIFPDLFWTFQKKKRGELLSVYLNLNLLVAFTIKMFY